MVTISLDVMPYDIMFLAEHASGVIYRNQIGGVLCQQGELEGALVPLDLPDATVERIMNLPYPPRRGILETTADALDALLAATPAARYLRVDRARLGESYEAWVFAIAETEEPGYFGAVTGLGRARGVLTWPNSD